MLDNNTMEHLSIEFLAAERVNKLFLDLGLNVPRELPIRIICNEIANIVIQDVHATFEEVANKCENEKDKALVLITNEQLYGKYGKL
jgi:hypothetical protein